MTSDFKPEVWSKVRTRSEKSPKWAKSNVTWLKFRRHIGNRCRWIHFEWQIFDRE